MARRDFGNAPIFQADAEAVNPGNGEVMADTGALPAGIYEARIIVGASVAAQFHVQRRNAADAANVGSVLQLYGAAGQSGQYLVTYKLEANERIRIVMDGAIVGEGACAIQVEKLT